MLLNHFADLSTFLIEQNQEEEQEDQDHGYQHILPVPGTDRPPAEPGIEDKRDDSGAGGASGIGVAGASGVGGAGGDLGASRAGRISFHYLGQPEKSRLMADSLRLVLILRLIIDDRLSQVSAHFEVNNRHSQVSAHLEVDGRLPQVSVHFEVYDRLSQVSARLTPSG